MALVESKTLPAAEDPNRDLGFGAVVARESRKRFLNKDGSFNVVREGLSFFRSLSPYHYLLTTSWPRFLALVVAAYLAVNTVFGLAFLAWGPGEIAGAHGTTLGGALPRELLLQRADLRHHRLRRACIRWGWRPTCWSPWSRWSACWASRSPPASCSPASRSRPPASCSASRRSSPPTREITAFEFRVANMRRNEMIQVEAQVMLTRLRLDGSGNREFLPLKLERDKVVFFPLSWTIVHPIDEASPLHGATAGDLETWNAEFLVLFSGIDETFAQTVHTRSSYKPHEIVWGARFTNLFNPPKPDGVLSIDIGRLNDFERLPPSAG